MVLMNYKGTKKELTHHLSISSSHGEKV